MTLAERILELRTRQKLSQGDLAERLEVSRQSVSKWETGQSVPELDKLIKLADLFGVSVDQLVREGDTPGAATDAPKGETPPAAQPQIVYVERPRRGLTTTQILGVVCTAGGAGLCLLAAVKGDDELFLIGMVVLIAGLPLLLAKKHPEWKESLGVVVFGNQSQQLQEQLPFHVYPLPYIKNEHEIVNIYNAVDLFAIPSLEENLPNMIMEAMACGVPCVGFNVGGIPEMIDHLHNGYVAQYKSSEDFANGIHWILTEPEYDELSAQACRKVLGNYSESIIAKKYTDVYNKITGKYA